jgi:hypothetical protein
VTKEHEQLRVLLSWKAAAAKPKRSNSAGLEGLADDASAGSLVSRGDGASLAAADAAQGASQSQLRLNLLEAQLEVLSEFIDAAGGWRAAVLLGPGFVNVDAELSYWRPEERSQMLQEITQFLKAQAAADAHKARAAAGKAERERQKLEASVLSLTADLATANRRSASQPPVVGSGGGADSAELLQLKAQLKLEQTLSVELHEKVWGAASALSSFRR